MARLIIWLHGLGDTGAGWGHLKDELALPGVRYLLPDSPTNPVSCQGGYTMTSWMDLTAIPVTLQIPDDEAGLNASRKIVHDLIDLAVAKGTPSTSIILGGFSQGCAMALFAGYSYSKPLAGVACFSGWPALKDSLVDRVRSSANAKTPAFIAHGTADEIVLPECSAKSSELLEQAGVPVTFRTYERMAHSSCNAEMEELKDWIKDIFKM